MSRMNSHPRMIIGTAIVLVSLLGLSLAATDLTMQPKAKGKDVTEAVVRRIQRSGVFPEDQDFLRRVAYVESKFGDDPSTYRNGYYGGIWQVDESSFQSSQTVQTLKPLHDGVLNKFGIDWKTVAWNDLQKPLFSGLAARLFVASLAVPIPGTLQDQAQFWTANYDKSGQGTAEQFVKAVEELESSSECRGRMDLCILLDSSSSIGVSNYETAKKFVADFIDTFSLDSVRVGFIIFSTNVVPIFNVDNTLTKDEMRNKVLGTKYINGGTNTNDGILDAVTMLTSVDQKAGVPKVLTVFTDGESNNGVTNAVAEALRQEIWSFSVGIGSGAGQSELLEIAYGDPSHVFSLTSFSALSEFFYRLNMATCTVPQQPELNQPIADQLKQQELRYYKFNLPFEGITIKLNITQGNIQGFYSYDEKTPSSAVNDGVIKGEAFIPPRKVQGLRQRRSTNGTSGEVYISVEGLEGTNQYSLNALEGDVTTDSSAVSIQMTMWVITSALASLGLANL